MLSLFSCTLPINGYIILPLKRSFIKPSEQAIPSIRHSISEINKSLTSPSSCPSLENTLKSISEFFRRQLLGILSIGLYYSAPKTTRDSEYQYEAFVRSVFPPIGILLYLIYLQPYIFNGGDISDTNSIMCGEF